MNRPQIQSGLGGPHQPQFNNNFPGFFPSHFHAVAAAGNFGSPVMSSPPASTASASSSSSGLNSSSSPEEMNKVEKMSRSTQYKKVNIENLSKIVKKQSKTEY